MYEVTGGGGSSGWKGRSAGGGVICKTSVGGGGGVSAGLLHESVNNLTECGLSHGAQCGVCLSLHGRGLLQLVNTGVSDSFVGFVCVI